ncbi:zinc finger protein 260-like isoform X2 [Toxorhynchites rutilus septentrionalis]|uniref:zinc finger protein 260-like isoform X2 n=2 Tax=Toxorhynchites rutilus septentrionalis TaxID=329112 RepID=UPI00247896C0|nr:zinc finger protein 260-like isoform X2 [Toxorhynchites rutilus septentrionalis]
MMNDKPQPRVIMELCRTCMSDRSIQLVPVYSKLDDAFIANIIMECTSIQIHENDGLPTNICQQCMETLRLLTTFIRTARDSDRQLRKIFKSEYSLSLAIDPVLVVDSSKGDGLSNDTDVFQFAEVKIEPSETLHPEENEGSDEAISSDSNSDDGRDSLRDDSDKSSDETESNSDWDGSDQGEYSTPREHKVRRKPGPKPRPKSSDSDDRPALNKRKPRTDEEVLMNEYEQELYTVIDIEKDKHICCGCLLIFNTAQELDSHRGKTHVRRRESSPTKNSSKIICDGCLRKYKSKRRVNYHRERVRQLQTIWECNKCKNRFSEATRRRSHAKKHPHKEGPTAIVAPIKEVVQQELGWICCAQACGQSFPTEKELITHALKAHQINKQEAELEENQNKPVQCQVCYRRFHDKNGLINHQQRLYRLHKYQCALCGLQFNSGGRLTEHELTHQNEKPFKCEVCDKAFTQKGNLKTHMSVHTNEKPFQCTVCGMAFRQKGGLKTHMSNHVENPQFKCEVCLKMFKAKLHLRYHMRIHNGERPFPCRYCEKAFTDFTNRMRHEMSHTGNKPYKCSYCEKSFIRKRFLLEHESTHTGVKLYNCDVCHQNFGQKNSLKKHMQTTHPVTSDTQATESISISSTSSSALPALYMPPQTHPIPLTNQQHQQLMAALHQSH